MNLADQVTTQTQDGEAIRDLVLHRCQLSKDREEAGDYQAASQALGEWWRGVGTRPDLGALDDVTSAEILLRAGVLTGCFGRARQIGGTQEVAKNFITEAAGLFHSLGDRKKVAEAHTELALCYWREGSLDEARVLLNDVLRALSSDDNDLRAIALVRSAIVEKSAGRLHDALKIYLEAAPLVGRHRSESLRGRFHNGLANVLKNLGALERRTDYIDRALVEFAAASYHFEQAGNLRYRASVENNLGMLFLSAERLVDAHSHFKRAYELYCRVGDKGGAAQVEESRARALLHEQRYAEASKAVAAAVEVLELGGEQSLLAEALTTQGLIWARSGKNDEALASLKHAADAAEQSGDIEVAGHAVLVILEELSDSLSLIQLKKTFERASELLAKCPTASTLARLNASARVVIKALSSRESIGVNPHSWRGFSLKKAVHLYERRLIERALKETEGVVSRAAQLLGFEHHQNLVHLLNGRHRELLAVRTPIIPRKRSLIEKSAKTTPRKRAGKSRTAGN